MVSSNSGGMEEDIKEMVALCGKLSVPSQMIS
jgi:hypothetical protein